MTALARVEDRLRRAVVLLELDDLGVREVVLEVEDVPDVRAAEAVDRVVRDEAARDEVVRALDVDVVDRALERDALDALDDVVAAVLGEHHHPGPHRRRRHERQRAPVAAQPRAQAGGVADADVHVLADAVGKADRVVEVLEACLDLPASVPRRPDRDAGRAQLLAHLRVTPADRDAMHRRVPATIAAERDRQDPPPALMARGLVMRVLDVQAGVVERDARRPGVRVDAREDVVDPAPWSPTIGLRHRPRRYAAG